MDIIEINDLVIFAKHGVLPEEKSLGQKFQLSVKLYTDLYKAGKNDSLDDTINYAKAAQDICDYFSEKSFDLIEAAAEYTAEKLLRGFYPALSEIELTVKKPWAPVGLPLEYCGITIHRKWHTAYLSLGSNMGNREEYLKQALEAVKSNELLRLKKVSRFIDTEPYGKTDQEIFLNAACEVKTLMSPEELLRFCNETEAGANRVRDVRWGPRTLDMDIIFYDDYIIDEAEPWLIIPHADMHNRSFVLEPMNEIAPGYIHPVYGESVRVLYERIKAFE